MNIGTKSVLFGVHQFLLHPVLIAIGWWKAYGFRPVYIGSRPGYPMNRVRWRLGWRGGPVFARLWMPPLWVAFIVHDLGYLGKPNMDGPEGETHPELGARIMRRLFGEPWGNFVLLHSRYYAKRLGRPLSPLCAADKWVIILEPSWLYLPRAKASGELDEFLDVAQRRAATTDTMMTDGERMAFSIRDARVWHLTVKSYMRRWIAEHVDGRTDTWTKARHP